MKVSFGTEQFNVGFNQGESFKPNLAYTVPPDFSIDYNKIQNKPQIEGNVLQGNKTFEELSLESLTNQEIEDLLTL